MLPVGSRKGGTCFATNLTRNSSFEIELQSGLEECDILLRVVNFENEKKKIRKGRFSQIHRKYYYIC